MKKHWANVSHYIHTHEHPYTHAQYQELKSFKFENYILITIRHVAVPSAEWERTLCVPQSTYNVESETDKYRAADTFSLSLHSSDSTRLESIWDAPASLNINLQLFEESANDGKTDRILKRKKSQLINLFVSFLSCSMHTLYTYRAQTHSHTCTHWPDNREKRHIRDSVSCMCQT